MRRIVVTNSVSLDGVMQAPGRPDEDEREGFTRGGWAVPYADPIAGRLMGQGMAATDALLLGRRTFEDFAGHWPQQEDNPFTGFLDNVRKYVTSATLTEPLPWRNSTLLGGDAAEAVAPLKREPGKDIVVLGSGKLVDTLRRHGLVDQYVLLIHPLLLGSGTRMFPDGAASDLELVESVTTATGVIIATYVPATARDQVPDRS
jgi:dihydrofolate reductase